MTEKPRRSDAGARSDTGNPQDLTQHPPPGRPAADPAQPDGTLAVPGQLTRDDRGNISWEWSEDPELNADGVLGTTARIHALAPKGLTLEEEYDASLGREPIPVRKSPKGGYDPYDNGEPKKNSWKKKRDLRQLSAWLALKKRLRDRGGKD